MIRTSPLAASTAPVMAPLPMEFHGSSLPLNPIRQQSKVENKPPHTAKLPAVTKLIARQIEGTQYVCRQRRTMQPNCATVVKQPQERKIENFFFTGSHMTCQVITWYVNI